ncbi:hypothetical protein FE782_13765 [Paenibacillus antri]|uniref:Uncharacterized protein n=1 Tax=Paenibacillus antri TaxID=2582848 RepID=A0A5R9GE00_9BACL|nr:AGE family epimerase/isomerase [Paenibacillus antri]TLS51568.1 hypothetical protein FE782_13765 [Paenibacillus antri]
MQQSTLLTSVERCLTWLETQMLTFDNGYNGVYERIRIDENIRVNWVRPDCNTEIARALTLYKDVAGEDRYEALNQNIKNWLMRAQDNDELSAWRGSFPFYLIDGYDTQSRSGYYVYQNDNGRILLGLLHMHERAPDERLLRSAAKLADYWVSIQRPEGYFYRNDGKTQPYYLGPDFVGWMAAALLKLAKVTGNETYRASALKAYDYYLSLQLEDGRMRTSYELMKTEDWRPVSSETSKAVYAFSIAYQETGDPKFAAALEKAGRYVLRLQHPDGGILNNDAQTKNAALQNNEQLCDLVYTQGFALMALYEAWKASGDRAYLEAAERLASFLAAIQCSGESPLWDGAWRGSYNAVTRQWDGRANQNNHIDEGGMYSVYTGWCASTIMYGMLLLLEEKKRSQAGG